MNVREIRALAQILAQNGLSALEVSEGETRIRLERAPAPAAAQPVAAAPAPALTAQEAAPLPKAAEVGGGIDFNRVVELKSPMVGVFYAAPSPDAPPFVAVGSKVKKGDVVCIIEAMKLMNEITAEQDGEIVDICAGNGDVVEYGQPLFKLF